MERKIKSILTISVSNEYTPWRDILFSMSVSYTTISHLIKSLFQQSILIIFPFCQQCLLLYVSLSRSLIPFAVMMARGEWHIFFCSVEEEQKPSVFRILMMKIGVLLKRCHFSNHLMCEPYNTSEFHSLAIGTFIIEAAVLNHYHRFSTSDFDYYHSMLLHSLLMCLIRFVCERETQWR